MKEVAHRMVSLGFTAELFPSGTHMCYLYNDEAERLEVMSGFVRSGLEASEKVGYFVEEMSPQALRDYFAGLGIAPPEGGNGRQLEIDPAVDVYCPDSSFSPERMLDRLRSAYDAGMGEGFAGVRLTGEMHWALRGLPGSERLAEYESRINLLVVDCPLSVICQYDANRFDGATLFKILNAHPMMIVHGQVVRNPYYLPPEQYFARYPAAHA
ncbi:MAG: MEDS domain-containing protein [Methylococcus sp.]|nr:MEDS domain-containing protein [Methylococcus sp.]